MDDAACRQRARLHRGAGFSLIELVVVVCVVAVLVSVGLERLLRYAELAEHGAMEQTAGSLRAAMHIRAAAYIATQQASRIAELPSQNPFDWLADKPANYAGALFDPAPGEVEPGNWYYERRDGLIVYLPRRIRYFVPGPDGRKWVRYRVVVSEQAFPGRDLPSPLREISSLAIAPVDPYNWFQDLQ